MVHHQRHEHAGSCSRSILDAEKVFRAIGLKKGDTFLDVGSSSGYFSLVASGIVGSHGKVYAVDIDEASIDTLKEEISARGVKNLEAIVADITGKTSLAGESIDVCLLANVLHGLFANNEMDGAFKEITRVLKTGATLGVVDFKKNANTPRPPVSIRLTPDEVTAIVAPYHYRKNQAVEVGTYHYAVVFSKE